MSKLEIFDPPMCCSTGVCGSSADAELARIAAVTENLKKRGIDILRHNLSTDPKAFMANKEVSDILNLRGLDALPLTVLDGRIVQSGRYLSNEEFARLPGVPPDAVPSTVKTEGGTCGCDTKGCCS